MAQVTAQAKLPVPANGTLKADKGNSAMCGSVIHLHSATLVSWHSLTLLYWPTAVKPKVSIQVAVILSFALNAADGAANLDTEVISPGY